MNGPNNPIGWTDFTWNPITGCKHGCRFGPQQAKCYAEVIAERFRGTKSWPTGFDPAFHPARLNEPMRVRESARIFCCSMSDLFGGWNNPTWIARTLDAIDAAHWHTFQLLTKAPWLVERHEIPVNAWMGTTITGGLANEQHRLDCVRRFRARVRFVSCEPMEGPVDIARAEPDWIIIGAATGAGGYQPTEAWVALLERWADANNVPIYHKDNLTIRPKKRHEWPAGHSADARPRADVARPTRQDQDPFRLTAPMSCSADG